jgi:hypothetical protein
MRDTDIYVNPEFVRDIDPDGMASLRKRYFGRVNLTSNPEMSGNDGIRTYIQLQQQFPDIYTTNVDDITSDADAIREILYDFEKARPREESVFGEASTEDEASQVLAERIMDAYFEVGNQSVKTQYQKTYKQLREEMKEDIIREYNDGLRAKQIDDAQALSNLNRSRKAGEISEDTYIVRKSALEDYKNSDWANEEYGILVGDLDDYEDIISGIEEIRNEELEIRNGQESIANGQWPTVNGQPIYDLNGHKVTDLQPGNIYVRNGKKVVVRKR